MTKVIGIDLGTTNCCVHIVENGKPTLIPCREGGATTPSVVAFAGEGKVLVGAPARRQAATNPRRTIFGIKRLMGRKLIDPDVGILRETCPYEIVPAANGDAWVRIDERDFSPPEISSLLLEHLKEDAERFLGEPVTQAVVTVPAFFDERQRQATKDAAQLAGLNVARLLNEPTAAALSYGLNSTEPQSIAVFDLGGGTFDVSVLEVYEGAFEVLASVGDNLLGGDDFDRRILVHLADNFYRTEGIELLDDPTALQRLYEAARNAKHELSVVSSVDVQLPFITSRDNEPLHLIHEGLTRSSFEALVKEELEALGEPCAMALDDCGLGTEDIDQVLLVGGMTRVPAVQRAVERLFRVRPRRDIDPDQIVAQGAALQASVLGGELKDVVLLDVTPHSLGIRLRGGRFSPVIARNSRVPCRAQKLYAAAQEHQNYVELEIYQGESDSVADNTCLGSFELQGLPYAAQVMVSFTLDANGLLSVTAEEPSTSRSAQVDIRPSSGLSNDEIDRLLRQRAQDRQAAEERAATAQARSDSAPAPDEPAAAPSRPAAAKVETAAAPSEPGAVTASPANHPAGRGSEPPPSETSSAPAGQDMAKPAAPPREASEPLAASRRPSQQPPPTPPPSSKPELSQESDQATIDHDDPLVGSLLDGRYQIEQLLDEGGMGRVYRARHRDLDRTVAIKVLHADLALHKKLAARFLLEARAAASIDNPHVVRISDFGRLEDGSGFLVMEYLEGITLKDLLTKNGGPLTGTSIAEIGKQLANGLVAAHDKGVIHRDLKPDNVTIVDQAELTHLCKLLDFGIAHHQGRPAGAPRLTDAGVMVGTPLYMAPEQIECGEIDARSDIYSLGVVLYELATGAPPFHADTKVGLLAQHKYVIPIPIRERVSGASCPPELEAIILKCLAKKPSERFASAALLQEALESLLGAMSA